MASWNVQVGIHTNIQGFDSFYGYYNGAEDYFKHDRSQDKYYGIDFRNNTKPVTDKGGLYRTNLFTEAIEEIVGKHNSTCTKGPFFIYAAYQAVHSPLEAPQSYVEITVNLFPSQNDVHFVGCYKLQMREFQTSPCC